MVRNGRARRSARFPTRLALLGGWTFFLAAPLHAAGDAALGAYLASECTACHQPSGRSTGGIPPIVGWPEQQFVAAFDSYGRKQRDNPVMQTIAARLSREEIAALAAYFGSLQPKP